MSDYAKQVIKSSLEKAIKSLESRRDKLDEKITDLKKELENV